MVKCTVEGMVTGKPNERETYNGIMLCTYWVKAVTVDKHTDKQSEQHVRVIAKQKEAAWACLNLEMGSAVRLTGQARPKLWRDAMGTQHACIELIQEKGRLLNGCVYA